MDVHGHFNCNFSLASLDTLSNSENLLTKVSRSSPVNLTKQELKTVKELYRSLGQKILKEYFRLLGLSEREMKLQEEGVIRSLYGLFNHSVKENIEDFEQHSKTALGFFRLVGSGNSVRAKNLWNELDTSEKRMEEPILKLRELREAIMEKSRRNLFDLERSQHVLLFLFSFHFLFFAYSIKAVKIDLMKPLDRTISAMTSLAAGERKIFLEKARVEEFDRLFESVNLMSEQINKTEKTMKSEAQKLLEANKELEFFAQKAAHDLKGPLNAIFNRVELLLRNNKEKLSGEDIKGLERIEETILKLAFFIDEILKYAKAGIAGPAETFALFDTLQEALDEYYFEIEKGDISLSIGRLPQMIGYPALVKQIFSNLISNSIKYQRDQQLRILVSCISRGDYWLVRYQDNGKGFKKEKAKQIFDPFSRAGEISEEGVGLGLAIVKKAVERHQGSVWAEPAGEFGAIFYIKLKKSLG